LPAGVDFTVPDKIITVRPQGRFKADDGTALVAAATAGLGIADLPESDGGDIVDKGPSWPVIAQRSPRFVNLTMPQAQPNVLPQAVCL